MVPPCVYMDPMNCSSNGTNVYVPTGQHMMPTQQQQQQQSSPTFPMFYSTSPPTPWIPNAQPPSQPLPPTYFMLPNHQQAQHFPFQQLI